MDSVTLKAFLGALVYQVIIPMLVAGSIAGFTLRGRRTALLTAVEHALVLVLFLGGIVAASTWLSLSVHHAFLRHGLFGSSAGLSAVCLIFAAGSMVGAVLDRWRVHKT